MYNNLNQPARLSMSSYDHTTTHEWDHSDLSMEDVLNAFYGLLVAQTWHPHTILTCMKDFAEERLPEMEPDLLPSMGAALPPAEGDRDDYDDIILGNHY